MLHSIMQNIHKIDEVIVSDKQGTKSELGC